VVKRFGVGSGVTSQPVEVGGLRKRARIEVETELSVQALVKVWRCQPVVFPVLAVARVEFVFVRVHPAFAYP